MAALAPLYPIVDHQQTLQTMAKLGYRCCQFRCKTAKAKEVEAAQKGWQRSRRSSDQILILNDRIDWALQFGYDGVHLGQEDLLQQSQMIDPLRRSKLIWGISTHSLAELQQALTFRPNYIAIGPLFVSNSKQPRPPLSKAERRDMVELAQQASTAIVGIGGITADLAAEAFSIGCDAIAFMEWAKQLAGGAIDAEQALKKPTPT